MPEVCQILLAGLVDVTPLGPFDVKGGTQYDGLQEVV
jgi:hypothetical protein